MFLLSNNTLIMVRILYLRMNIFSLFINKLVVSKIEILNGFFVIIKKIFSI